MIRSPVGTLVYTDGEIFAPPVILRSSNGWLYKPDEMRSDDDIRLGRNRSFPRRDAEYAAGNYVESVIVKHHEDRNYEKPVSSTGENSRPNTPYGDELCASFYDKTFGWVDLTMEINESFAADNPRWEIVYEVKGSSLLEWLSNKKVTMRHGGGGWSTLKRYETTHIHIQDFIDDPWGTVTSFLEIPNFEGLLDPPDLSDLPYTKNHQWDDDDRDNGIFSASSGNALFYKKGVIEEVFQSDTNWETVEKFFDALKFVGFSLKPTWSYGNRGYSDMKLSGLVIEIPKRDETHGHTIYIDATNPHVRIDCGYMRDENRWIDRKQREATKQMAELEDALQTFEYEIEL